MLAEGRVQPKTEILVAAGTMLRVAGHREDGPARAEAAHAQYAQAGADTRACSGAPLPLETAPQV